MDVSFNDVREFCIDVDPSSKALVVVKLCQNAFQTIPDISCFDVEKKNVKILNQKINFFEVLELFLRIDGETDLRISFRIKFCFRYIYPEVCTTSIRRRYDDDTTSI